MKRYLFTAILALSGVFGLAAAQPAHASPLHHTASAISEIRTGVQSSGGRNNNTNLSTFITRIINAILFLLGAVAVIMIVIGGIRYVMSNGDPGSAKAAKDTILYAVIGLIVAVIAYAIVRWVIDSLGR